MSFDRRTLLAGLAPFVAACGAPATNDDDMKHREPAGPNLPVTRIANVMEYGARGDGQSDDSTAISKALSSLVDPTNTPRGGVLYFPAGTYLDSGRHVIPTEITVSIVGDGPGLTTLVRQQNVRGTWWNLLGKYSSCHLLTFDGRNFGLEEPEALLALNAGYTTVHFVHFYNAAGTALEIGNQSSAIVHRLSSLQFRNSSLNHINVLPNSGSTDGLWSDIDGGISGRTGVVLGTGAQNISNLHVWGAGVNSDSDNDGIRVESANNVIGSGWQSEKNLGIGVVLNGDRNQLHGGRAWGNCGAAVQIINGSNNLVTSNSFFDNAIGTDQARGRRRKTSFIEISNSRGNLVANNVIADTGRELTPAQYSFAPKHPYPGRPAPQSTEVSALTVSDSHGGNNILANMMESSGSGTFISSQADRKDFFTDNR